MIGPISFLQTNNGNEFIKVVKGKESKVELAEEFTNKIMAHFSQMQGGDTIIKGSLHRSESNRGTKIYSSEDASKLSKMTKDNGSSK